jgi:hypothetical protein
LQLSRRTGETLEGGCSIHFCHVKLGYYDVVLTGYLNMPATKTIVRVPPERERRAAARMTGRYLVTIHKDAHKHVSDELAKKGF